MLWQTDQRSLLVGLGENHELANFILLWGLQLVLQKGKNQPKFFLTKSNRYLDSKEKKKKHLPSSSKQVLQWETSSNRTLPFLNAQTPPPRSRQGMSAWLFPLHSLHKPLWWWIQFHFHSDFLFPRIKLHSTTLWHWFKCDQLYSSSNYTWSNLFISIHALLWCFCTNGATFLYY